MSSGIHRTKQSTAQQPRKITPGKKIGRRPGPCRILTGTHQPCLVSRQAHFGGFVPSPPIGSFSRREKGGACRIRHAPPPRTACARHVLAFLDVDKRQWWTGDNPRRCDWCDTRRCWSAPVHRGAAGGVVSRFCFILFFYL